MGGCPVKRHPLVIFRWYLLAVFLVFVTEWLLEDVWFPRTNVTQALLMGALVFVAFAWGGWRK